MRTSFPECDLFSAYYDLRFELWELADVLETGIRKGNPLCYPEVAARLRALARGGRPDSDVEPTKPAP